MSFGSKKPNNQQRQEIAKETQSITYDLFKTTRLYEESKFYPELLPKIDARPNGRKARISVVNKDSFTAGNDILDTNRQARVGVLNMASEKNPGGGWLSGALAQEEALCLRSTLAATLYKKYYPLPIYGAIWSPNVLVFRDELQNRCRLYRDEEKFVVGVVSLAAIRRPLLTKDGKHYANINHIMILKYKMRQVFRVLAKNGITHCVLGAMGCGAFRNPPHEVARIYKEVLNEDEWNGVFEEIVFAVLDTRGESNYTIFKNALVPHAE